MFLHFLEITNTVEGLGVIFFYCIVNISYILAAITQQHRGRQCPAVTCSITKIFATYFRPKGWQTRWEAFPGHIEGQVRNGHEWSGLDQPASTVPTAPLTGHGCTQCGPRCMFQSLPFQVCTSADTGCIFKHWRINDGDVDTMQKFFFRELRHWKAKNGERGNVRGLPQNQSINTQYTYNVYW